MQTGLTDLGQLYHEASEGMTDYLARIDGNIVIDEHTSGTISSGTTANTGR